MMKVNLTPPHTPWNHGIFICVWLIFTINAGTLYHDNGDPMGICHHGNWSFPPPLLVLTSFFGGGWVGMVSIQRWTAENVRQNQDTWIWCSRQPNLGSYNLEYSQQSTHPRYIPLPPTKNSESRIIAGKVLGLCSFQVFSYKLSRTKKSTFWFLHVTFFRSKLNIRPSPNQPLGYDVLDLGSPVKRNENMQNHGSPMEIFVWVSFWPGTPKKKGKILSKIKVFRLYWFLGTMHTVALLVSCRFAKAFLNWNLSQFKLVLQMPWKSQFKLVLQMLWKRLTPKLTLKSLDIPIIKVSWNLHFPQVERALKNERPHTETPWFEKAVCDTPFNKSFMATFPLGSSLFTCVHIYIYI